MLSFFFILFRFCINHKSPLNAAMRIKNLTTHMSQAYSAGLHAQLIQDMAFTLTMTLFQYCLRKPTKHGKDDMNQCCSIGVS